MLMARRKKEKQDVSKMTIEEVDKMAKERGISYGQMVILLEQGKV
jgi:ribosomal protein L20